MKKGAAFRSADELIAAGLAPPTARAAISAVAKRYAIAITPSIAELISVAGDGVARQFVPDAHELISRDDERLDPIGDAIHTALPGVVHRYEDRALFKIVSVCPVYCRFCFRREIVGPGKSETLSRDDVGSALKYFRTTPAIREVILTGGDPLVLASRRVGELTTALCAISHIEKIRWHTRVPIVDPARVTDELVAALTVGAKRVAIAIHANHAREFTHDAIAAIARLRQGGVQLLSQSVLLKGINDDVAALDELISAFLAAGVTPYYLHHADLAPGTSHFRTSIAQGRAVMRELAQRLPQHALPRYMLDIPGGHGKIDLMSDATSEIAPGVVQVIDRFGAAHVYRDAL